MSPPRTARKQKRWLPPTPHAPAGCGPATKAEGLALVLGKTLAEIARSHSAYMPTRKDCDSEAEFYAAMQRYEAGGALSIAGALSDDFSELEEAVVLAMLDVPELLRRPLTPEGYGKVRQALREAEPSLAVELKKGEVARIAARTARDAEKRFLEAQGDLFAGLERGTAC
jgi:hypothetical protein